MGKSKPVKNKLLLLDLDGVTVVGQRTADGRQEELRLLHPELPSLIREHNVEVVVFTHRAYADAKLIRSALENLGMPILHCVSAREMMLSALKQLRFIELLSAGMSKKYGVANVLAHYDIRPSELVLIDDRPEILKEVLKAGVGLVLHAPFERHGEHLVTFNFAQALEILGKKRDSHSEPIQLNPIDRSFASLPVINVITTNRATVISLMVRRLVRKSRQLVLQIRG